MLGGLTRSGALWRRCPSIALIGAGALNGRLLTKDVVKLAPEAKQSIAELGNALDELRQSYPERSFMGQGVCVPGRLHGKTAAGDGAEPALAEL